MQMAVARPLGRFRSRLAVLRGRPERDVPGPASASRLVGGVVAHFAAPRLDGRLAGGEDPSSDIALACRAKQLVSVRSRRRLAKGLQQASAWRPEQAVWSA